jgi:hypothetical protein
VARTDRRWRIARACVIRCPRLRCGPAPPRTRGGVEVGLAVFTEPQPVEAPPLPVAPRHLEALRPVQRAHLVPPFSAREQAVEPPP